MTSSTAQFCVFTPDSVSLNQFEYHIDTKRYGFALVSDSSPNVYVILPRKTLVTISLTSSVYPPPSGKQVEMPPILDIWSETFSVVDDCEVPTDVISDLTQGVNMLENLDLHWSVKKFAMTHRDGTHVCFSRVWSKKERFLTSFSTFFCSGSYWKLGFWLDWVWQIGKSLFLSIRFKSWWCHRSTTAVFIPGIFHWPTCWTGNHYKWR